MSYSYSSASSRKHLLLVAVGMNFLFGVLYAWSIFLEPLENFLGQTRTVISFVPALGLLSFTIGVYCHSYLLRYFSSRTLVSSTLALAGLGHLLFGYFPSYIGLLLGYGILFGVSCGTGYGLALHLARNAFIPTSGWSVGLVVAAFAAGGMTASMLAATILPANDLVTSFQMIGWMFCVASVVLGAIAETKNNPMGLQKTGGRRPSQPFSKTFLQMAFGYYAFCFLGLAIVSHSTAILYSRDVSPAFAGLGPVLFNLGYIVGACIGGVVTEKFPNQYTPTMFMAATLLAVISLIVLSSAPTLLMAVAIVGIGFGSIVSIFVMILSAKYEEETVSFQFGRLNIGYGLAGLSAPAITGWLYDLRGQYDFAVSFAGIVGFAGLLAVLRCRLNDSTLRDVDAHDRLSQQVTPAKPSARALEIERG